MKDFVLASYRPMKDAETEAHLIVNDDAMVFVEIDAVDVVVFHYGSLKTLFDKLVEVKA